METQSTTSPEASLTDLASLGRDHATSPSRSRCRVPAHGVDAYYAVPWSPVISVLRSRIADDELLSSIERELLDVFDPRERRQSTTA